MSTLTTTDSELKLPVNSTIVVTEENMKKMSEYSVEGWHTIPRIEECSQNVDDESIQNEDGNILYITCNVDRHIVFKMIEGEWKFSHKKM